MSLLILVQFVLDQVLFVCEERFDQRLSYLEDHNFESSVAVSQCVSINSEEVPIFVLWLVREWLQSDSH